jgi:hypothetical protein
MKNKIILSVVTTIALATTSYAVCSADVDMGSKELQNAKLKDASLVDDMNASSKKITNLATPTANTDAANKSYVDDTISSSISSMAGLLGYGTIQYNSLTWLDRNLGATKIPSSATDTAVGTTGYLFQWGRPADGHQFRKLSDGTNDSDENAPAANQTSTLSNFKPTRTW